MQPGEFPLRVYGCMHAIYHLTALRQSHPLSLDFAGLARLANQQTPGTCLSLFPKLRSWGCEPPCLTFYKDVRIELWFS